MLNTRIQILRAVAVLVVILNHFGLFANKAGFFGVDLFFVISGFVISNLLLKNKSLKSFYIKRVNRILPAAFITLVLTVVMWQVFLGSNSTSDIVRALPFISYLLANKYFYTNYTDYFQLGSATSPFLHYWSLAVEEQFYLLLPTLFLLLGRGKKGLLKMFLFISLIASYIYFIALSKSNPTLAFYSPFARAWELIIGVLISLYTPLKAEILKSKKTMTLLWVLVLSVFTALTFVIEKSSVLSLSLMVSFASVLVFLSSYIDQARSVVGRSLIFIGNISYSLYLTHFPIYIFYLRFFGKEPSFSSGLLLLGLTFLISTLLFKLIENPLRNKLNSLNNVAISSSLFFMTIISAILVASMYGTTTDNNDKNSVKIETTLSTTLKRALQESLNPEYSPATTTPELNNLRAQLDLVDGIGQCVEGATICSDTFNSTGRNVVLFGDSHATMWWSSLYTASRKYGFNAILFSKGGCPPAMIDYKEWVNNPPPIEKYNECKDWFEASIKAIKKTEPEVLIVTGSGTTSQWASKLDKTYSEFKELGSRKILLADFVYPLVNILDCYSRSSDKPINCSQSRLEGVMSEQRELEKSSSAVAAWEYYEPDALFCLNDRCPSVVSGLYVYRDQWHLTRLYGKLIAEDFARLLKLDAKSN